MMTSIDRLGLVNVGLRAALAVAVVTIGASVARAQDIPLGVCQSTASGPAKFATALWKGASAAIDEANASGGIGGRKLRLVAMDIGNNDPAQARLSMKKAFQFNAIPALLCWGGPVMIQNAPLYDELEVLAFTMSQGVTVPEKSKYIQQLEAVTTLQCRAAAEHVKARYPKVKSLGVLFVNYEYGRELRDKCREAFAKINVPLVVDEAHSNAPPDLRAQFTKIVRAKPDALYLAPIGGGTVAQAIRTGREMGFEGIFITHGAGDTPDVYDLKLAEKDFFFLSHPVPENAPMAVKEATRAFGGYASAGYDFAWISAHLMRQLVKQGKPITGPNMTTMLREMKTVRTPVNEFKFLQDGNTIRPLGVFRIANGGRKLERILTAGELE